MSTLKLSPDVAALNPGITEVEAPKGKRGGKAKDEAGLFLAAWDKLCAVSWLYKPEREHRFAAPRMFRFDWAFPEYKLAVEVDGGNYIVRRNKQGQMVPVGQHMGDSEREKMNLAAGLGWRVMHFTPKDLKNNPAGCVEQVLAALTLEAE